MSYSTKYWKVSDIPFSLIKTVNSSLYKWSLKFNSLNRYIVGRGVLTPLFYKDPLILPTPLFSNFVPPTPTAHSIILFLWLNGWWRHIWCAILLNDIMDLHMRNLGILVPEGIGCFFMQQGVKFTEVWHKILFFAGTLIWCYTQHKHTQYTEAIRLTHPYEYIFTPPVMWSLQLSLLQWIIHWYQIYFSHCLFFSKIIHL